MRSHLARSAAIGAAIGLAWGIVARVWMRLISTEPEFTWTGTLLIIGFATWLAMAISVVYHSRKAGRSRWVALLIVPGLGLFLAQGSTLFPAFAIGSALWNRVEPKTVRLLIAGLGLAAIVVPAYLVWNSGKAELTGAQSPTLLIGFTLMSLSLAYAASYLWRPVARDPSVEGGPLGADGGGVAVTGVDDGFIRERKEGGAD